MIYKNFQGHLLTHRNRSWQGIVVDTTENTIIDNTVDATHIQRQHTTIGLIGKRNFLIAITQKAEAKITIAYNKPC